MAAVISRFPTTPASAYVRTTVLPPPEGPPDIPVPPRGPMLVDRETYGGHKPRPASAETNIEPTPSRSIKKAYQSGEIPGAAMSRPVGRSRRDAPLSGSSSASILPPPIFSSHNQVELAPPAYGGPDGQGLGPPPQVRPLLPRGEA